jgi:hypothetical protein
MDPALPPGGLYKIFQQYDAIKSHSTRDDGPAPWEPEEDVQPPAKAASNTPPPEAPKETSNTSQVLTAERPRGMPKAWANNQDEKAQLLMEERMRASHANKLLLDREKYTSGGVSYAQDEAGMGKAYNDKSTPGTYLDPSSHTLYVKGTVNAQDWWDDFTKVPAWGDLKDSFRYKDAERAYDFFTRKGEPIDRVVGHSLGGSVALELQKNKAIDFSRTFGAPVLDPNPFHRGSVERIRHPLDPVSVLDRGAKWGPLMSYPHTYTGFQGFDEPAPYMFDVGQKTKKQQQSLTA